VGAGEAMSRIAILIANQIYREESELGSLRGPFNDIDALRSILEDRNRGKFDEILTLKDSESNEIRWTINGVLTTAKYTDTILSTFLVTASGEQVKYSV